MEQSLDFDIRPVVDGKTARDIIWPVFAPHHYFGDKYNGHEAYVALLEGKLVGFASCMAAPNGLIKQPFRREHRTVVLPDYQGLGIGTRLSDWLAEHTLRKGRRYYSRTAHPRMGEYRERSPLWKPTSKNRKVDPAKYLVNIEKAAKGWQPRTTVAYSHEYVGQDPDLYAWVLEQRLAKKS